MNFNKLLLVGILLSKREKIMSQEFIIGLTEHRTFGQVFHAFTIEKQKSFYSVVKLVKSRDIQLLQLNPIQAALVELTEQYSDEKIVKTFSKKKESSQFFHSLDPVFFEDHISPYIDKYMNQIIRMLMNSPVRLFYKQNKYGNLYDEDLIEVSPHFMECCFFFTKKKEGTYYQLQLFHEGNNIPLLHKQIKMITSNPGSLLWHQKLYPLKKLSARRVLPFLGKEKIFIPSSVEKKYYQTFVLNTIRNFTVHAEGFQIEEGRENPRTSLKLETDWNLEPLLQLVFHYGSECYVAETGDQQLTIPDLDHLPYRFIKITRNIAWEKQQQEWLKSQGLTTINGRLFPKNAENSAGKDRLYTIIYWLQANQDNLKEAGISIDQQQDRYYALDPHQLTLEIKNEGDWFDLYSTVKFGEYKIPFIRFKKHILNGIREFKLPNGHYVLLPVEWFKEYADLLPYASVEGDRLRFQKYHYQLIRDRLKGIDQRLLQQLDQLHPRQDTSIALPERLQASLRSYQIEGYRWMYQLQQANFGGCLADDMGLGKTIQTLALLLKLKRTGTLLTLFSDGQPDLFNTATNTAPDPVQPASLIVIPTSVLHNWQNEIQRFTPGLKVYKHFGNQRKQIGSFQSLINYYDIILTSYGTVRNDIGLLREHEFFYIILDESQNIKNPGSKVYQSIMQLQSRHRLAITGTPIENSLSDLWTQINFINKGLLGNLAFFKREFIIPIERKNDADSQEKLKKLIAPFILRRTKEQVARDLPVRTEQIRYCNMSRAQEKLYEEEKSAIRNSILENIEKAGFEKSTFLVLQGLTRLRLLANHPVLLKKDAVHSSGKFDEIVQSLKNIIVEKHKVLVFSSFVKHLNLLQKYIQTMNWRYSMLTGQSTNREKIIRDFQENQENRIFLISLKAGGVGLNLTSADYVFILDPWWNPAAENQAINRAHRIGQNKKVFVYRFITENSIEEKIHQLQHKKSALADKFVNSKNTFHQTNREELLDLLK